jgi:protease IV
MKKALFVLVCTIFISQGFAQTIRHGYYGMNALGMTSPGAMKYGLYGYDNPAVLSTLNAPDFYFSYTKFKRDWNEAHEYGLYAAVPKLGFGLVNHKFGGHSVTNYMISGSLGDEEFSIGSGYGWTSGAYDGQVNEWTIGTLVRPNRYVSLGATVYLPNTGVREGMFEAALRPLKSEVVTLFADYVVRRYRNSGEPNWSTGLAVEALPGIRLTGRFFADHSVTAGVQFSLGRAGLTNQEYFDKDQKLAYSSYGIRIGGYDRNVFTKLQEDKNVLTVDMHQGLTYQKYKILDKRLALKELLENIEAAKNDATVGAIAIKASELSADRELLWEVRTKLKEFKAAGKKIFIFIDRGGLNEYHFASIADKIVIDPTGTFVFEGYAMGRSYLKGTLEKLGIGFDELRFFKYKSANESFSRDKMSDADREQRQKLVDDMYAVAKDEIVATGRISAVQYDSLINNKMLVLAAEMRSMGLADTVARWEAVEQMLKDNSMRKIGPGQLEANKLPSDNYWGRKPEIAVIYALGVCAMDEGISARSLVKDVKRAVNDNNVKAIVLRVDSPGGDAMASDYISEALLKAKGKKPVIVSQGKVAASGGYWLSMYADTIVAAPTTITGSVGVIGGWIYNKGFKEMLGGSTDAVKKGDHADLGLGFTIPFIGLTIPDRDLNTEERARVETAMRDMYKQFITNVAKGRNRTPAYIDTIGQGRVWSGIDGKKNGLVDVIGGLQTAIDIAAAKAGLANEPYIVTEYPEPQFVNFDMFMPKFISSSVETDPVLNNIKFRTQFNGLPLLMVPSDMEISN